MKRFLMCVIAMTAISLTFAQERELSRLGSADSFDEMIASARSANALCMSRAEEKGMDIKCEELGLDDVGDWYSIAIGKVIGGIIVSGFCNFKDVYMVSDFYDGWTLVTIIYVGEGNFGSITFRYTEGIRCLGTD